jgi:hypothetical protein
MPGTPATANLAAGTDAPCSGVYVMSHHNPAHAPAQEIAIVAPSVLPRCPLCADVRFSLKYPAQPIEENEFFRKR